MLQTHPPFIHSSGKTLKERVYKLLATVPKGKVTTYGYLGKALGTKAYRAIGQILHVNKDPVNIPCHRVVNAEGKLSLKFGMGGPVIQEERLVAEGVEVRDGRVDLEKYLFDLK